MFWPDSARHSPCQLQKSRAVGSRNGRPRRAMGHRSHKGHRGMIETSSTIVEKTRPIHHFAVEICPPHNPSKGKTKKAPGLWLTWEVAPLVRATGHSCVWRSPRRHRSNVRQGRQDNHHARHHHEQLLKPRKKLGRWVTIMTSGGHLLGLYRSRETRHGANTSPTLTD